MDRPKNYLIDMDGVLLRGNVPIPGAPEFLARLEGTHEMLTLTQKIVENGRPAIPSDGGRGKPRSTG